MRARIIKIGNSQGIRIPKPILEQSGIMEDVEIIVDGNQIVIRPLQNAREGWDDSFKEMTKNADDELLINDRIVNDWDDDRWQW